MINQKRLKAYLSKYEKPLYHNTLKQFNTSFNLELHNFKLTSMKSIFYAYSKPIKQFIIKSTYAN